MWLLAFKALWADRGRFLTALLGVAFAVVLINLQGGLLLGLIRKAALLVDYGRADVWVGHRHMNDAETSNADVQERWVQRIRSVPGVQRADAYVLVEARMATPDGHSENVVVVGCDPASLLGAPRFMAEGDLRALRQPDSILIDSCDCEKLGQCRVGDIREINGQRARIVGLTEGLVGFTTRPYVFTTIDRARNHFGNGLSRRHCSYFLVQVQPGADVPSILQRIRQRVPELDAYDRETYSRMSMWYWLTRTGIGISFGLATFLGVCVGLGVVAQTLYASVVERLKEFGTLKALGADDRCVALFLLTQALVNAVSGSALGLLVALVVGFLASTPRAPIQWTGTVALASVVLVHAVCLAAAWLPYWRISRIDVSSVLRS